AFDRNMNVVLLDARNLGLHVVRIFAFGYIDADRHGRALVGGRPDWTKKAAKQLVEARIGERIVKLHRGHFRSPFCQNKMHTETSPWEHSPVANGNLRVASGKGLLCLIRPRWARLR